MYEIKVLNEELREFQMESLDRKIIKLRVGLEYRILYYRV